MAPEDSVYDFAEVEARWQKFWLDNRTFRADDDSDRPKFYILDMFPYPSGAGLHVGHPEGYTATDILARYKRMRGFEVLHPMGWDSFGLPAEQYALKTGIHPEITTKKNIDNFRRQIRMLGLGYDWEREIATSDSSYYRWTQWIFLKLFEHGLAYQTEIPVNFCPALGTVLADEEVIDGRSERGGHPVERRPMRQWMLKITAYADKLLDGLDDLDWPDSIKEMQRNWIGRSEGAEVDFTVDGTGDVFRIFTTRVDTLFGVTFMVLAPEHPLVQKITTEDRVKSVGEYVAKARSMSDIDRTDATREKTGVFTGAYAVNPVSGDKVPIWVADYVLSTYGTGAIMAVPGHDDRDYAFARKFGLPVIEVVSPDGQLHGRGEEAFTDYGVAVNSGRYSGMATARMQSAVIADLQARGIGKASVQYRLRDWVFSRQRYWGEPFPLVHMEDGSIRALSADELPVTLPPVTSYEVAGTGESPLATIEDWVSWTDPRNGARGRRETHTMPQWAGSCWYYLRYLDPHNDTCLVDPEKERKWMPVDLYVGGAEHAVLHLLYARFWHHFLYDIGAVSTKEPFRKLVNQGLILGEDGQKMSKSRGNVVNPDDVVREFGADAMRLYEMFMGPLEVVKPWTTRGVVGTKRFIDRIWRYCSDRLSDETPPRDLQRVLHQTIRKVTEDIEKIRYNTALAQMMTLQNEAGKAPLKYRQVAEAMVLMLSPFAPHVCEELWERMGHRPSIVDVAWPGFDPDLCVQDTVEVAVQINGKVRGTVVAASDIDQESLKQMALGNENVARHLQGMTVRKVIVVGNRVVNIVAG
ncbi:MAG TPA: leucine--tRNA ligase [Myxococcota bacterium]|nr:leucine--tRNA ligase [Myxococcota bacterium]